MVEISSNGRDECVNLNTDGDWKVGSILIVLLEVHMGPYIWIA